MSLPAVHLLDDDVPVPVLPERLSFHYRDVGLTGILAGMLALVEDVIDGDPDVPKRDFDFLVTLYMPWLIN